MNEEFPLVDLEQFRRDDAARMRVASAIDRACRTSGFFLVTGHGIDPSLIRRMREVTHAFFTMPLEEKLRYRHGDEIGCVGYAPMKEFALDAAALPDLSEGFNITSPDIPAAAAEAPALARTFFRGNVWPDAPADFRHTWEKFYRAASALGRELMSACAVALRLPASHFESALDHEISHLTCKFYPEQPEPPPPGQFRAAPHTDFGALTLLLTERRPGGLEVLDPDGRWRPVDAPEDTFIANLGDLMAQWTNDLWRSTVHRVVNPPPAAGTQARRLSLVFFQQPNHDALIECLPGCRSADRPARHARTTSGEHYYRKLADMRRPGRNAGPAPAG